MLIKDIVRCIEAFAPLKLQESYDNSGLIIGSEDKKVKKTLISLDITEEILEEAIEKKCELIITHHPLIFSGIKRINGNSEVERIIIKALKYDIAIYAAHTNLDSANNGVSYEIAERMKLKNINVLKPKEGLLKKIVVFCPISHSDKIREEIFKTGGGHIGEYDCCSYNVKGFGTFRANENAKPFVGNIGEVHQEEEIRIETVIPSYLQNKIVYAIIEAHPYEEVAYDIYPLENTFNKIGLGVVGKLQEKMNEKEILLKIKDVFSCSIIKHSQFLEKKVSKIAICGGAGASFINDAIAVGADLFITADIKYHDFQMARGKILLADIGHYESEQHTKELIYNILMKKFPNFAFLISEIKTNFIKYI